jgi:hypothetical protein
VPVKIRKPITTVSTNSPSTVDTPYYVKACALGIPAYLIGVHLWSWVFMMPFYLGGHSDFRQLYAAASMVRAGHASELYDPIAQQRTQNELVGVDQLIPFVRPAYETLLFVPLSFLRYRTAYFVFLGINLVMLAATYSLLRPWMSNLAAIYPWLPAALFLAFLPIGATLIEGQDSLLLLLILTAAFRYLAHGQETFAGILAGLGVFKLQMAIPLLIVFLVWRRWRFVKGFLLSAGIAGIVSVWIMGINQLHTYIHLLLFMAQPTPVTGVYPLTISRMTNLHGLIYGIFGAWVSPLWVALLTAATSVALLFWLSKVRRPDATVAIVGSTLLSYYLFYYEISSLLIPVVVTLNRFVPSEGRNEPNGKWTARLVSLLFVSPLLISYAPEHLYLITPLLLALLLVLREQRLSV